MKVALVHDWLNQNGGAEKVLEVFHEMYPDAPIYTSIFEPRALPPHFSAWDIRTSFMQRLPLVKSHHQPFLPLYPLAFAGFDLSKYDLVLSNSSGFCHGVSTSPSAVHINYCLTPPRFLWDAGHYLQREQLSALVKAALAPVVLGLRKWDAASVKNVDYFVAISAAVKSRIERYYKRSVAGVLYPPVEAGRFHLSTERGEYYLIVSRLVPYKRVDLAVKAFNRLGHPLLIAGTGRDRKALEAMAGPNVRFLGWVPDEELPRLYAGCRAFIFPGEEDFGIGPLEAQAAGRLVVAYGAGGALETVVEGVTGAFFHEPSAEALAEAVERLEGMSFDHAAIRSHALGFDTAVFKKKLSELIEKFGAVNAQP